MSLFDEKTSNQLKDVLKKLENSVNIAFFKKNEECETCKDGEVFANEITAFSDKLNLTVYDLEKNKDAAKKYSIDKTPAYTILDEKGSDNGIRFFGIPGGHEINSFIGSLMEVSGNKEEIPHDIAERITAIERDVHIEVFVTLS